MTWTTIKVLIVCALFGGSAHADHELKFLTWNVESGSPRTNDPHNGNDPDEIGEELGDLQAVGDYDIIALTEVRESSSETYQRALGDPPNPGDDLPFARIVSDTGGGDRMVILYRRSRFEPVLTINLHEHDGIDLNARDGSGRFRFRSPLLAKFRDLEGSREFFVMVNHLARGAEDVRQTQARGIREWAKDQTIPVVTLGDFNFDVEFNSDQMIVDQNRAFEIFMEGSTMKWLRTNPLVDTNWADTQRAIPRRDRFPNSILDFVFVAGTAKDWHSECKVIVRPGDLPDSGETSDHRPIGCTMTIPDQQLDRAEILSRIESIRVQLDALENLVRSGGNH